MELGLQIIDLNLQVVSIVTDVQQKMALCNFANIPIPAFVMGKLLIYTRTP